ncbi:hypothetical protein A2U01_0106420, partial [Trifolium medium]|nr:hypothetical protein [Trifolium medium]
GATSVLAFSGSSSAIEITAYLCINANQCLHAIITHLASMSTNARVPPRQFHA